MRSQAPEYIFLFWKIAFPENEIFSGNAFTQPNAALRCINILFRKHLINSFWFLNYSIEWHDYNYIENYGTHQTWHDIEPGTISLFHTKLDLCSDMSYELSLKKIKTKLVYIPYILLYFFHIWKYVIKNMVSSTFFILRVLYTCIFIILFKS